jgi:hypothetical protein
MTEDRLPRSSLSVGIVRALARRGEHGYELPITELQTHALEGGRKHTGTQAVSRAIAMLTRAGIVWTVPPERVGHTRIPMRVGLTQMAIEIVQSQGIGELVARSADARGLAIA